MNRFVKTLHDDLTPRFGLRHSPLRLQDFGGTLARKTQLAQSILSHGERSECSFCTGKQIVQPLELMNWRCSKNADLNVAGESVNNLSLHVFHI